MEIKSIKVHGRVRGNFPEEANRKMDQETMENIRHKSHLAEPEITRRLQDLNRQRGMGC